MSTSLSAMPLFFAEEKYSKTDPDLRLRQAAFAGDFAEVCRLIQRDLCTVDAAQRGTSPDGHRYSGMTALHQAVIQGHEKIAQLLVLFGWSISLTDTKGKSALDYAKKGHFRGTLQSVQGCYEVKKALTVLWESMRLAESLPDVSDRPLRVISLACGLAIEPLVLNKLFPGRNIEFIGIDNDAEQVSASKTFCATLPNVTIYQCDARDLSSLGLGDKTSDLVILRQPDIFNRSEIFSPIVTEVIPKLVHPGSKLFLSTYHKRELQAVQSLLLKNFEADRGKYAELQTGLCLLIGGLELMPDKFSLLLSVSPALQETLRAEASAIKGCSM